MVKATTTINFRDTPKAGSEKNKLKGGQIKNNEELILLRGTATEVYKSDGVKKKRIWAKVMTKGGRVGWVTSASLTTSKVTKKLEGDPEINNA